MKNKCKCYHLEKRKSYTYNQFTGKSIAHDIDIGFCFGTKEIEECSCCGDKIKCNFYPEVRAKAEKNISIDEAINYYKYGISHGLFKGSVTQYAKLAVEALEKMKSN